MVFIVGYVATALSYQLLLQTKPMTSCFKSAHLLLPVDRYAVFRGANMQKHIFKQDPKAPIWGQPPKVIDGKLLVSGYW